MCKKRRIAQARHVAAHEAPRQGIAIMRILLPTVDCCLQLPCRLLAISSLGPARTVVEADRQRRGATSHRPIDGRHQQSHLHTEASRDGQPSRRLRAGRPMRACCRTTCHLSARLEHLFVLPYSAPGPCTPGRPWFCQRAATPSWPLVPGPARPPRPLRSPAPPPATATPAGSA